jgi:non-specific serine/threonine protein kinase
MIPMPRRSEVEPAPLPARAVVGSFVLARVHSRDEFVIRYGATASASGGEVLIEEFAPVGLAMRDASGVLRPRSAAHAALWEEGLHAFVGESELLTRPLHPALLRVACLWRLRGTAFRLLPRFEECPLAEVVSLMSEPPTEGWLRDLVEPLLDALESLHNDGWVHGNVCPGQIVMRPHGGPLLLDTGAVRAAIGARMPHPAAWPEPGFRPPELAEPPSGQALGAWSDLYALAAVARFCMGAPHAAGNLARFPVRPIGLYDGRFVAAFESALANDPHDRPQTVAAFRQRLKASADLLASATLPGAASFRMPASSRVAAAPLSAPEPPGPGPAPIEFERDPHWRTAPPDAVQPVPLWARETRRARPPAQRSLLPMAGLLAVVAGGALAAYLLIRDEVTPFGSEAPATTLPAEQLLERAPTAAGPDPVAQAAPEPLREPAQSVAPPPTVAEAGRPLPAAARSEPAPRPVPPGDKPVTRRAAVADKPASACAPRTNFALYRCMQKQCELSRYQSHPQCVRLRQNDELPS